MAPMGMLKVGLPRKAFPGPERCIRTERVSAWRLMLCDETWRHIVSYPDVESIVTRRIMLGSFMRRRHLQQPSPMLQQPALGPHAPCCSLTRQLELVTPINPAATAYSAVQAADIQTHLYSQRREKDETNTEEGDSARTTITKAHKPTHINVGPVEANCRHCWRRWWASSPVAPWAARIGYTRHAGQAKTRAWIGCLGQGSLTSSLVQPATVARLAAAALVLCQSPVPPARNAPFATSLDVVLPRGCVEHAKWPSIDNNTAASSSCGRS